MVEISKSGSGEGLGRATARGYSTRTEAMGLGWGERCSPSSLFGQLHFTADLCILSRGGRQGMSRALFTVALLMSLEAAAWAEDACPSCVIGVYDDSLSWSEKCNIGGGVPRVVEFV